MTNIFKHIVLLVVCAVIFSSCRKSFDEMGADSNRPVNVTPSFLLNSVLNDMYEGPFGSNTKWCQYFLQNYDYYGNNRYDFGEGANFYSTLKNVVKMEEETKNAGAPDVNCYEALAKFFKAYFFTKMSLEMGDIPMNEALQGVSNLTPVYDSQKQIFVQAFEWLESANADINSLKNSAYELNGDFYFNNDITKWQKVINSFRIRLLLELSKKVADTDLDVKGQFQKIISQPTVYPLMMSASDNVTYVYIYPSNQFSKTPDNFGQNAIRECCSKTYVSLLTSLNDPRVYATCEPAQALFVDTVPTKMSAFVGADPGEDLGVMYLKTTNGLYSLLNRYRYYRTYTGENSVQIGYPELCFNIAKAINRGWSTTLNAADAEEYYKMGIKASLEFYDIPLSGNFDVHFMKAGAGIDASDAFNTYSVNFNFDTYYNQSSVKYDGNTATGLTQILQQRYLSMYLHSGLEAYFTYRRTGVPTFTTGPGTGNSERIALRFQYPSTEITTNEKNYKAALTNQFGSENDDINALMWVLK